VRQNGSGEGLAVSITFRSYHWNVKNVTFSTILKELRHRKEDYHAY
jgi:hypothetical protein